MTVWLTVNQSPKRWRNRYVYLFPTHGEQTTNATATVMLHERLHKPQLTLKSKCLLFKWKDAHWVEKLERADEYLLVIRELTRTAGAGQRQARVDKWNLGSVKAVLNRIQELKATPHISRQTEVHYESSVGQTRACTTEHKVHLRRRSTFVQV